MTARADFVEDVNVECEALIRKFHHRLLDFSKLELDVQTGGMIVNQNEKWSEKQEQLRQTLIAQEQRAEHLRETLELLEEEKSKLFHVLFHVNARAVCPSKKTSSDMARDSSREDIVQQVSSAREALFRALEKTKHMKENCAALASDNHENAFKRKILQLDVEHDSIDRELKSCNRWCPSSFGSPTQLVE